MIDVRGRMRLRDDLRWLGTLIKQFVAGA